MCQLVNKKTLITFLLLFIVLSIGMPASGLRALFYIPTSHCAFPVAVRARTRKHRKYWLCLS